MSSREAKEMLLPSDIYPLVSLLDSVTLEQQQQQQKVFNLICCYIHLTIFPTYLKRHHLPCLPGKKYLRC